MHNRKKQFSKQCSKCVNCMDLWAKKISMLNYKFPLYSNYDYYSSEFVFFFFYSKLEVNPEMDLQREIQPNDRIKIKYEHGRFKRVYDATVLRIKTVGTEKFYFVHYHDFGHRFVCYL